jgi:hypothetical protein
MSFHLFEQPCKSCGKPNLGPREGAKARGRWLGYDDCLDCRKDRANPSPDGER